MKYLISFLFFFSVISNLYANEICIKDIVISSTSYKTEGQIPYITIQVENLSDSSIHDIELELISMNSPKQSLNLLKPNEIKNINFPWLPEVGIRDYSLELQIYWFSESGEEQTLSFRKEFENVNIRHEEVSVHPWLTRQANNFLQSKFPGGEYQEIADYIDQIAAGSTHEDDGSIAEIGDGNEDNDNDPVTERSMRHFYRPTDDSGLKESPGYPWHQFSFHSDYLNSLQWGNGSSPYNEYDWMDAIEHYLSGNKTDAYFTLGHVVHLLEDLSVPAHTHLDIHAGAFGLGGDDFENYCNDLTPGQYTSSLPVPQAVDTIIYFDDLASFWENPGVPFPNCGMANLSYYRNYYQCDLSTETGKLKEMYPNLWWDWLWGQWDINDPDLGNWDENFGTVASSFNGSMGDDEWWECTANYNNPDVPGYYYLEWLQEVPEIEKSSWEPSNPANDIYAINSGNKSHVEYYADDLIPLCIRYAAGLMKFFYDEVNSIIIPPDQIQITVLEDSIHIEWSSVPYAVSYNVYSCEDADGMFTLEGVTSDLFFNCEITEDKNFYKISSDF